MTLSDYNLIVEALASCAIEGNKVAIELLELRTTDPDEFIAQIEKLFSPEKEEE
jgi:hypothetical protein